MDLVFTTGYPNQKSKVLGSYRPPVRFSLFHERVKFPSKGGRQLENPPLSTGPHLMDKLLCYLRMVRVPQLFMCLHWAGVALAGFPRVWPLLSSGPHACLVTSSCIRVLILSGLVGGTFNTNKNKEKHAQIIPQGWIPPAEARLCQIKDASNHPSMLEWFATDPEGLYIGYEISSPSI